VQERLRLEELKSQAESLANGKNTNF